MLYPAGVLERYVILLARLILKHGRLSKKMCKLEAIDLPNSITAVHDCVPVLSDILLRYV